MILVIAEHDNQTLKAATLSTVTAALQLKQPIHVLVAGDNCKTVAEAAAKITGIEKVIHADAACYQHPFAETFAEIIQQLAKNYNYVLAPATTFGKNILPRAAALLDVAQISDVVEIVDADTFVRPIYAGNALATVRCADTPKLLSIRGTAFKASELADNAASIESCIINTPCEQVSFVRQELSSSDRPELVGARVVVSGGRGMQNGENFRLLETLAECLGAAIGASRAAVDAGFVPNDYQVGQTGKIVAPELYIAVGISGAIQHLAGMKDSKVIVAINKDPDAPIFQVADYGLVGDLFEIIPELITALNSKM